MAEVAFTSNPQDQKNLDNYIHYITSMGAVVHTRLKEAAQSHPIFNRRTQESMNNISSGTLILSIQEGVK